jgi:MFS family permease
MNWSRGDASWAQTIHGLLYGVFVPVAAYSINKLGARLTLMIGIAALILGSILLGTVTTSITAWIIIWGVVMSFGFALGGVLPVQTTVTQWFEKHRATAIGLAMTAGGLGGFIAQPLFAWIIGEYGSWQTAWLFSSVFAITAIFLVLLVVNKPSDRGQHPDGIEHDAASKQEQRANEKIYKTVESWTLKEALRTPTLWLLILLSLGGVMPLYLLVVHGVLHLTDLQFERMEAASVLSAMLAGSACARFPVGWLGDRMEPRRIIFTLFISAIIALNLIWKAPGMGLLLLAGAMFGATYGGMLVMIPTMVANYFGAASFASINGFIFPVQIAVASLVPVTAGYMADASGNYDLAFMSLIGFTVFSAVCSLFTRPPIKRATL